MDSLPQDRPVDDQSGDDREPTDHDLAEMYPDHDDRHEAEIIEASGAVEARRERRAIDR